MRCKNESLNAIADKTAETQAGFTLTRESLSAMVDTSNTESSSVDSHYTIS